MGNLPLIYAQITNFTYFEIYDKIVKVFADFL